MQAAKAGLLEIADIFVVNKADRPGADATRERSRGHARARRARRAWRPPIVRTVATDGDGVDELWDAIGAHRALLESTGDVATRAGAPGCATSCAALVAEQLLDARRRVSPRASASTRSSTTSRSRATRSVHRGRRAARRRVSAHPLRGDARRRRARAVPAGRRVVEVVPSPGPAVPTRSSGSPGTSCSRPTSIPTEVAARGPPGDFSVPMSAASLDVARASSSDSSPRRFDALLVRDRRRRGRAGVAAPRSTTLDHPRVERGVALPRRRHAIWTDRRRRGVLIVGRGLCGRWEIGYEVAPRTRGARARPPARRRGARARPGGRAVVGAGRAGQRGVDALDARRPASCRSRPRCSSRVA